MKENSENSNESGMNESFKDTHEYENSIHVSTMKILTVVNEKSKVSKNEWKKM